MGSGRSGGRERPLALSAGMCYPVPMEPYELIRSGRKTLALEITKDCRVVVRAPRHLAEQRRRAALTPPAPTKEELADLKAKARQMLLPKVAFWSERMGLRPTGVKITAARTRYGSCSGRNSLCFSCFLANAPEAAVDLVVVHELCHIRVKNHGPDFYALLERTLPDWRERKRLLR